MSLNQQERIEGITIQEQWEKYRVEVLVPFAANTKEVRVAKRAFFTAMGSMLESMRTLTERVEDEEQGNGVLLVWEAELASFSAMVEDGVA